jgi:exopolysaccharide biosynthesis predicted pyruvyltransferase EpsI
MITLKQAHAGISHDMAFMLNPADFDARRQALTSYLDRVRLRRHLVRAIRLRRMALARRRNPGAPLHAFRADIEASARQIIPPVNFDLSGMFAADDMSRWSCEVTASVLKTAIAPYAQVETDRLHVAILATLMRKPVRMFDNVYGKNRDVFEHSIQGYFCNAALEA